MSTPWRHFPLATQFIVMQFDRVIDSSINRQLSNIWDRMKEQGIALSEKRLSQSSSKQCHFGVWEHYSSIPRVTQDSRNQNLTVEATLDEFLMLLGKHVIPGISNLLHRYDKQNWERQKIAHQRVLSFDSIQEAFKARPSLDFQGIFFTLAIKDSGSEILHLDWSDHPWTYAWVILLGEDWEGGELCLPQLGRKIPTHPGQVIAFTGHTLAHFAATCKNSRRLVCTGYSDAWVIDHAFPVTVV
ncbi:hypothetical protein K439DRAFT_1363282 [Ramaria rubella]|nr:hypothetical protein K439DRAFT_1363282 [Ramaria rubella]